MFQCFVSWFALLIFQPCCGTDLREISGFWNMKFLKHSWFLIFGEFPRNCLLKSSIRCNIVLWISASVYLYHLACGINSNWTEVQNNIMSKSDNSNARIVSLLYYCSIFIHSFWINLNILCCCLFRRVWTGKCLFQNIWRFIIKAVWFFYTYLL